MSSSAQIDSPAIVRGVLESVGDRMIVLSVPGTSYELNLVSTVAASQVSTPIGKRIKGTIQGKALRMFAAAGGGRFIEPVVGEPRIVAGVVRTIDTANRRILIESGVPMWLTLTDRQPAVDTFAIGQLVNCYVESGMTFTPE